MRFKLASTALAGLLLLTGCTNVVSLNPLVAEKPATTHPALPGTWIDSDGKDTIVIRLNGPIYAVTYVEKSGTAYKFDGRLFKIGDATFLDLVTTNEAPFHIPVHFAMRIWIDRDTFRMAFLDTDWFKKQLAQHLSTEKIDGRTVITAQTPAIQAFLEANAADDKAHGDPETMRRMQ